MYLYKGLLYSLPEIVVIGKYPSKMAKNSVAIIDFTDANFGYRKKGRYLYLFLKTNFKKLNETK